MKAHSLIIACFSALLLSSCDEGDINEKIVLSTTGKTAKITTNIFGVESWPSGYNVVIAGFTANNTYANISKNIPASTNGEIVLSGISDNVTSLEICVINRLRERIVTLYQYDCSKDNTDTIVKNAGTINAGMFPSIQNNIFTTTCARCHGLGKSAAANLNLTSDSSYISLVQHESTKSPGKTRVVPNNVEDSYLYDVISGNDTILSFNHTNMIANYNDIRLIEKWISNGAEE
ncbi:MAG: hypothetical protein MJ204_09340 [Bacteroidales bacterium]|nr:hypothetical protein [Bacteroidales bacterium]